MKLHKVSDYRKNCPESWADDAHFMALYDVEAMWMSFGSGGHPVALLVGAGGVNALTGEKLGTKLEAANYLVAPPQPWLDGWKDKDGTVYQFVATPHKKGDGLTVGEQLIGAESKTGAIGIAVFNPKDPASLKIESYFPTQGYTQNQDGSDYTWQKKSYGATGQSLITTSLCVASFDTAETQTEKVSGQHLNSTAMLRSSRAVTEMGVGKGGKIIQHLYPDPHGLDAWEDKPVAVFAVYLIDAATAEEITGEKVAAPAVHDAYNGLWFGLKDDTLGDVPGTDKFSGLKSAAFPGDTTNAEEKEAPIPTAETVA
jgi:hypothetical protein